MPLLTRWLPLTIDSEPLMVSDLVAGTVSSPENVPAVQLFGPEPTERPAVMLSVPPMRFNALVELAVAKESAPVPETSVIAPA